MSNLIDSSLPEEDSNWSEQQQPLHDSNPITNISTGFGSSPFDDYAVNDMDLSNEPFGSSTAVPTSSNIPPSSDSSPFTLTGDLMNMSTDEVKQQQALPPSPSPPPPFHQSAPTPSPPPPPPQQQPVLSHPEPIFKSVSPTPSNIRSEIQQAVDNKPEEPKQQPKTEAKEVKKQQSEKKESKKSSNDDASLPSSSTQCCSFLTRYPQFADLIYWRDLKISGAVFIGGLLLLLSLACCSIISVISNGSLLILGSSLSYRVYSNIMQAVQKTDEGHPFKKYIEMDIIPSEEKVHEMVDKTLKHLNVILLKLRSIFLVEDTVDSIKYFVLFWCLTYLGAWFNGITLVIMFYLGLFSIPKLYEMNKSQIDAHLALACSHLEGICSQVKTKLPFLASKKEKAQ